MESITSAKNPKVALWRSLKDAKGRRETGCFLAEGHKVTGEALAAGFQAEALLVSASRAGECLPALPGVPVYCLPDALFASVCDTRTPQGIAAVLKMQQQPCLAGRLVVLDGVQDPGNVGTILRTADAVGLDGVLLSSACADPFSPKVVRAAMGSLFHLPVEVTADLPARLGELRQAGLCCISSQLDGELLTQDTPWPAQFALVIGNEGRGVSPEVKALCDRWVKLPMAGRAESLNAGVAAGVLLYLASGLLKGA